MSNTLAYEFFGRIDPDALGEFLRATTFVGDGFGCYENFDVRPDAVEWTETAREDFWIASPTSEQETLQIAMENAQMGKGYTFTLAKGKGFNIEIDVCWYWDGDGCLDFVIYEIDETGEEMMVRRIENTDCKKSYGWKDLA